MLSLLLATSFCISTTLAAISSDQLKTVFGTADGLQAGAIKLPVINGELMIVANTTHAVIAVELIDVSMDKFGWLAIGVGTTMADADEVMAWPSSDYAWTLSHRAGAAMQVPDDQGPDTTGDFVLIPALTSADSSGKNTQVAWLRKLKATYTSKSPNLELKTGASLIYSMSMTNPEDCKHTTMPAYHDGGYGQITARFDSAASGNLGAGLVVKGGATQASASCTAKGKLSAKASNGPAPAPGPGGSNATPPGGNNTAGPPAPIVDKCTIPSDSPYAPYSSFICPAGSSERLRLLVCLYLGLPALALFLSHLRRFPR